MDESKSNDRPAEDDDCFVCVGLSFLNAEISRSKKKPTCFGLEYKAAGKIEEDTIKGLPTLPPSTALFLLGMSQASGKMHHNGQVPVLKYGLSLALRPKDSTASQSQHQSLNHSSKSPEDSESDPAQLQSGVPVAVESKDAATPQPAPTAATKQSSSPIGDLVKFFSVLGTLGGNFLISATGIASRLPSHLPRASYWVSHAVSRRLEYEWDRLKSRVRGHDSTPSGSK